MSFHAEFGRTVLQGVGINTGKLQKLRALELCCLGVGGVADTKIHLCDSLGCK